MALERVQKIMSNAGYCSRRKAEELIADGKVLVNSTKIKLGDKADLEKDTILISGKPLLMEQRKYYAFYKPDHVLTSLNDPFGKPTIADYIDTLPVRVIPVGRLDYDAEGLLILTNDGDFANKLMHPRYETSKTYEAELRDRIRDPDLAKLRGTIKLDDGPVKIEACRRLNETTLEITIHEGRHKIVKRIFKDLGFYVKRLKRTQVGPIKLERMRPGEIKEIPEFIVKEVMKIEKKQAQGNPFKKMQTIHVGSPSKPETRTTERTSARLQTRPTREPYQKQSENSYSRQTRTPQRRNEERQTERAYSRPQSSRPQNAYSRPSERPYSRPSTQSDRPERKPFSRPTGTSYRESTSEGYQKPEGRPFVKTFSRPTSRPTSSKGSTKFKSKPKYNSSNFQKRR
jgi:pseudouridine synthase